MYILRRLLPFGVFSIGLELLYKTGLMAFEADKPDFAAAELLKTFGVMLLTTAIAACGAPGRKTCPCRDGVHVCVFCVCAVV